MADCLEYIVLPTLPTDNCNGCKTDVKCVVSTDAYTLLGISANASLDVILNALVIAINAQNTLINAQNLIIENLEQRVEILES